MESDKTALLLETLRSLRSSIDTANRHIGWLKENDAEVSAWVKTDGKLVVRVRMNLLIGD